MVKIGYYKIELVCKYFKSTHQSKHGYKFWSYCSINGELKFEYYDSICTDLTNLLFSSL